MTKKCYTCNCNDFAPNFYQPNLCTNCLHNHDYQPPSFTFTGGANSKSYRSKSKERKQQQVVHPAWSSAASLPVPTEAAPPLPHRPASTTALQPEPTPPTPDIETDNQSIWGSGRPLPAPPAGQEPHKVEKRTSKPLPKIPQALQSPQSAPAALEESTPQPNAGSGTPNKDSTQLPPLIESKQAPVPVTKKKQQSKFATL